MYAQYLLRVSRSSLNTSHWMINNVQLLPRNAIVTNDVGCFPLAQEQQQPANPHLKVPPPEPYAFAGHKEPNFNDKLNRIVSSLDQPRGSFRTLAPRAFLSRAAEMAAALAMASLSSVHSPAISDSPCTNIPLTIEAQLHASPFTVLNGIFTQASSRLKFDGVSAESAYPASIASSYSSSSETSVKAYSPPADTSAFPPTTLCTSATEKAASPDLGAPSYRTRASSSPIQEAEVPGTASTDLSNSGSMQWAGAAAASYLPVSLRPLVPSSLSEYWKGVNEATCGNRLHATIYISSKSWAHAAHTIAAMIGTDNKGPKGQVRFALVPLGTDYAFRVYAARTAYTCGSSGTCASNTAAATVDDIAAQFGLDVALAACVAEPRPGDVLQCLDTCPAMVIRGGYTGSTRTSGVVYPSWSMRQELDVHVRRNLLYTEQQLLLL